MEQIEIQDSKSVTVSNISPNANEKTVSDFFSFCGKIAKLFLTKQEGTDTSVAVVQFETESAAKTALLLTNALIIDRPITVAPYGTPVPSADQVNNTSTTAVSSNAQVPESNITQRDFHGVPDDQRSKTSVVASLIAAGYVLTSDAFEKAKEVDEKHMISLQAKVAVEQVKAKIHEIDITYGISEKALNLQKQATDKLSQLDEQYHLSEKAKSVGNQISATTTVAVNKVKETVTTNVNSLLAQPAVAQKVAVVQEKTNTIKNTVSSTFKDLETETHKAIEEKQKEKVANKAADPTSPEHPKKGEEEQQPEDKSTETTSLLSNPEQKL